MEIYIVKEKTIGYNHDTPPKYVFNRYEPEGINQDVYLDKQQAIKYGVSQVKERLFKKLSENLDLIYWPYLTSEKPDKLSEHRKTALLHNLCTEMVCIEVYKQEGINNRLTYYHTMHNININVD